MLVLAVTSNPSVGLKGGGMEIEQQVASLELCKKLKALGVKQESAFYWYQRTGRKLPFGPGGPDMGEETVTWLARKQVINDAECVAAAFTVAELGASLIADGVEIKTSDEGTTFDYSIPFEKAFPDKEYSHDFYVNNGWSEADARAAMMIYLIEKGIVKP